MGATITLHPRTVEAIMFRIGMDFNKLAPKHDGCIGEIGNHTVIMSSDAPVGMRHIDFKPDFTIQQLYLNL